MKSNNKKYSVSFSDLEKLVSQLPHDIELTIVGGQALQFWASFYHNSFTQYIEQDGLYFATTDIDFVASSKDAIKCARAWGASPSIPGANDITPNTALIELCLDGKTIRIDFLSDYLKPGKLKNSFFSRTPLSPSRPLYVLSPFTVMLAKIANILVLKRNNEQSIGQLKASFAITKCYIEDRLKAGEMKDAQSIISQVLYIAGESTLGIQLYKLSIDVVEALPADDKFMVLDSRFVDYNINSVKERLYKKRTKIDQSLGCV